jgi:hypothetical protein
MPLRGRDHNAGEHCPQGIVKNELRDSSFQFHDEECGGRDLFCPRIRIYYDGIEVLLEQSKLNFYVSMAVKQNLT